MAETLDVQLGDQPYFILNIPLITVSLLGNFFYIYFLVPSKQQHNKFKQPLKVLLLMMAGSNGFVEIMLSIYVLKDFFISYAMLNLSLKWIMIFAMSSNMASSVFLNVFYFCQIVPARHAFSIWMKRNLKTITYCFLSGFHIFFLIHFIVQFLYINSDYYLNPSTNSSTLSNDTVLYNSSKSTVTRPTILSALMYFEMFFAVFAFWAMTLSSLSTVDYLRRHISSMGAVGISSSPHLRSQIRVTVIGIIQGGLFSLCSLWIVVNICFFQKTVSTFDPNNHILVTVFTLYSFGTTINLGVGQAVLRQRVSNMLVNVKKAFH